MEFQIRTESHLSEERGESFWTDLYPSAVFDGKYVFFLVEERGAYEASKSIREKTNAKHSELSIWPADKTPPWKTPT